MRVLLFFLLPAVTFAQTPPPKAAPAAATPAKPATAQTAAPKAAAPGRGAPGRGAPGRGAATARPAAPKPAAPPPLTTDDQKTVYALGLSMAKSLAPFDLSPAEIEILKRALADAA